MYFSTAGATIYQEPCIENCMYLHYFFKSYIINQNRFFSYLFYKYIIICRKAYYYIFIPIGLCSDFSGKLWNIIHTCIRYTIFYNANTTISK